MPDASDALELARQAQAAAELLWLRGDREDALERAVSALETTISVAPAGLALGSEPASLLRAAQVARRDALADDERAALVLPLLRARRRAERRITRALESAPQKRARLRRVALGVWCALVVLIALALYRPHGLSARATATLARSDFFGAARAIDGDRKTAWLLPDRTLGTLDLDIVPPRDIRALRLVQPDASSPPRGTTRARIRLYRGLRAVAQQRVTLTPSATPRALDVAISARGVTRVEVQIEAWRGTGGGLAEVELR